MEIKEQSGLRQVLAGTPLPKMCKVRQIFKRDGIEDVPAYLQKKLDDPKLRARIKPGMRVVLTGSSRQIANMSVILRKLAQFVKEQGAQPYIIPAMGSHGGATDEGQRQILESYGITEEFCGCPIFSSMETVRVGELPNGDEVRVDKFAHDADAVIVVGRIKAHTAFRGPYESGLIKMMAIGMGKRAGADSLHSAGFGEMGERLPLYAKVVFDSCNIIFGVAPIENEFDQTCRIEVIPAEEIFDKEPDLLLYAKSRLPRLLIPETDVLVVREIGKNFSGSGMDPNVTGTFGTPYASGGIQKQRTVVLDISEESHGSFIGLGMADTTTKRAFEKLDTNATYFNMITSTVLKVGKIPMVLEDDKLALQAALKTLTQVNKDHIRMVYIKNTLSLETIMVSEALLEQVRARDDMEIMEEPRELRFDESGALLDFARHHGKNMKGEENLKNKQYKLDIIPGIVIALFSIGYMAMIPSIKTFTGLGATPLTNHFVPYLWGGALLVLGLWITARGFRKRKKYLAEGGTIVKTSLKDVLMEKREVVASFIALTLYVGLMGLVGFAPMTILYVFVQIMILTPKDKWKKIMVPAIITAVISGGVLFYIFRYLLNVLLPVGILSIFGL